MLDEAARHLADDVLFPAAMEIDAARVLPRRYLDLLADAGLYDLPTDPARAGRIIEALGGGSLTTAFVWIQHHSPVRALQAAGGPLADRWLADLRAGRARAGIAYAALRRPGPPAATARPVPGSGGWVVEGHAPWVTGWGLVDVILAAARSPEGDMVWFLLDARTGPGLSARPVELAALQASATFELRFEQLAVPAADVVAVEPYEEWRARDAAGRANNGYLALGVAGRCARLLGSAALASDVDDARDALDRSTPATVTAARAGATLLAMRAATAVVAAGGGRSVEASSHAARLLREAMFLTVFAQTPEVRAKQMEELGVAPQDPADAAARSAATAS